MISIVVPVYKCGDCLLELYERIVVVFKSLNYDFELILVDDASPDNALLLIRSMVEKDKRVKCIRFTRNFGQHYAITAGLRAARGIWIIVMDGDLQNRPEEIPFLYYAAIKSDSPIVLARNVVRSDNFFKRYTSMCFYVFLRYLTETNQDPLIGNFGIYNHSVIDIINNMQENLRFFPVMVRWTGFPIHVIDVQHDVRHHGHSSYTLKKLFYLAFDVFISFSNKPLWLMVRLGIYISGISFIGALYIFITAFTHTRTVLGWSSLIISIWFLAGLIVILLGIIGLYIGKIFDQVKQRPLYVIQEKIGDLN